MRGKSKQKAALVLDPELNKTLNSLKKQAKAKKVQKRVEEAVVIQEAESVNQTPIHREKQHGKQLRWS